ncbi:Integrase zinc binding domain [Phytophthora infestans]|uniref:Integrase zinc binding domain n=1 Tax=Phytophthora infestans TaxID=4787 RepID=A0A833SRV9_PHYIN|nr:Integrase zinc binding domain [Phytophthora infestans]
MHPGEHIMLESVKASLRWPGMTTDVNNWVRNCEECAKPKTARTKYGKLPTKTMEVRPWAEMAVDSNGPFGKQKWKALTIIDTSTRLVEIAPVADEFRKEFTKLLKSYGVEKAGITAKHPQANGVIERVHRAINNTLRTESMKNFGDRENCLSAVMFALRAQYQTATSLSSSQPAFGRDMLSDFQTQANWNQQQHKKMNNYSSTMNVKTKTDWITNINLKTW